jgi:hypothetical protein
MDIFSTSYAPFAAALLVVAAWGLFELLTLMTLGSSVSSLADMLVQTETFPETAVTNWLMVKGLPLSIAIVLFLTSFGMAGMALQFTAEHWFNQHLVTGIAVCASGVIGFFGLKASGRVLAPLFQDKTTAVSAKALVGLKSRVISPRCTLDMPAEGRVQDLHGYTHQVMIVPAVDEGPISQGDSIVLVEHLGLNKYAIRKA